MKTKKSTSDIKQRIRRSRQRTALAFVPKPENQFRPFLIRRLGLVMVIAIAFGIQIGYNFSHTGSVLGQVVTISPNSLLDSTNQQRAEAELPALVLNDQLSQAAMFKANDIIQNQYWDHTSPTGVTPWYWINKSGYAYQEAGENLAKNFTTASATVAGWMSSDGHRANILKPDYTDVGFAITTGELDGKPTTIIVALYAQPLQKPDIKGVISPLLDQYSADSTANNNESLSPSARINIAVRSLTPAAITSIVLLFISVIIATTAHLYQRKLPKRLQKTWYKRHGAIKASILLAIIALIVLLYGSGSL